MKFEVDIPVETEEDRKNLRKFVGFLGDAKFADAGYEPVTDIWRGLRDFENFLPPLDSDVTVTLKRSEWEYVQKAFGDLKNSSPIYKIRDQVNRA